MATTRWKLKKANYWNAVLLCVFISCSFKRKIEVIQCLINLYNKRNVVNSFLSFNFPSWTTSLFHGVCVQKHRAPLASSHRSSLSWSSAEQEKLELITRSTVSYQTTKTLIITHLSFLFSSQDEQWFIPWRIRLITLLCSSTQLSRMATDLCLTFQYCRHQNLDIPDEYQ